MKRIFFDRVKTSRQNSYIEPRGGEHLDRRQRHQTVSYLSADELEVTEAERAAIIDVRNQLARGEMKHVTWDDIECAENEECNLPDNGFCMSVWNSRDFVSENCGSACCIGGWAEKLHGVKFTDRHIPYHLDALFYAVDINDYDELTPEDSVRAIDNWLTTKVANWSGIRPDLKT